MTRQGDADAQAREDVQSGYDAWVAKQPLPARLGDDRDPEGGRTS